jgi:colicin import membrane protein
MRAIAIIIILAVVGFFGYQYAAEGRGPGEAVGVLTGATQQAEAAAAQAAAAAAQAAAAAEAAAAATAELEAAANAALEEANAAVAEATQAGEDLMAMAGDLLTVDGFDEEKVTALLDTIDIPESEKNTLTTALGFAKDDPALLQPVLDDIKNLLGM